VRNSSSSRFILKSLTAQTVSNLERLPGVCIAASGHDAFDGDQVLLLLPAEARALEECLRAEECCQTAVSTNKTTEDKTCTVLQNSVPKHAFQRAIMSFSTCGGLYASHEREVYTQVMTGQ